MEILEGIARGEQDIREGRVHSNVEAKKPCRVIYKIDNETVYILHVARQERDLRRFIIHETEAEYQSSLSSPATPTDN